MYKLRCRKKGIVVTEFLAGYDIVWKRTFTPKTSPKDSMDLSKIKPKQLKLF